MNNQSIRKPPTYDLEQTASTKRLGMRIFRLIQLAAAMSSGLVLSTPAVAVTWTASYLGSSEALGINNIGQVVGAGFITGANGIGMTALGTLGGYWDSSMGYTYLSYSIGLGVNTAGQVVGLSSTNDGYGHGFITGANGIGMIPLGTLGGSKSEAFGINDAGRVVGWSYLADNVSKRAFITGPNGTGMTDLGTLSASIPCNPLFPFPCGTFSGTWSEATAINGAGQVVGNAETFDGKQHAFLTGANGTGMTDLGTLGGGHHSWATGINATGQVVGWSYIDGGNSQGHAFITGANGVGMRDLGTLGGSWSFASGINTSGQVVGSSNYDGTSGRAFITGANGIGMTDLNTLVTLPWGDVLSHATGVNDLGQVIAVGTNYHSYLLSPINAYKISAANGGPFSDRSVIAPAGSAIGTIQSLAGTAIITRSDGSTLVVNSGDHPDIFFGDTIETSPSGSVNILFADQTTIQVSNDAKMTIDEFVYDPTQDAEGKTSFVRDAFVYTSGFIGKEDPTDVTIKTPVGAIGIRGDASQYINDEYLDVSVKMNVGSPVTLSTAVDVPDTAFDLSFQYIFLTETGTLDVFLDGRLLRSFSASAGTVGLFQYATLNISDADLLALGVVKLAFTFDGPKGSQAIVDDISMPGLLNGDFSHFDQLWSKDGPGTLELVATISEEKWAEISAVPEPETYAMMLAGLGLVGLAARRRQRLAAS